MLLSKSVFLRSLDCPVCLRHVAVGLPSNREGDEFLRLLVEGGFQFEKLVRHAWPGTELPRAGFDHELAHRKTVEAIRTARSGAGGTLHEATILHDGCLARIDMLRVSPDGLEVCEVKAKSFPGTDDPAAAADVVASGHAELNGRNGVRNDWRRYLADIAFQIEVLERWLRSEGIRGIEILPRLIVANRNQRSGEHDSLGNLRVDAGSALGRGMVTPGDIQWVRCPPAGFRSPLICELDVTMEVAEVRRSVSGAAESPWGGIGLGGQVDTAKSILAGSREADPARYRGWKCRNCEFHTARATEVPTGFDACWGSGAHSADALLRLYRGGKYRPSSGPAAAGLAEDAQGRDWVAITVAHTERHPVRIADLPPDAGPGVQARTRNLQIAAERSGDVQCSEDFAERVQRDLLRDPRPERVHFLDFETSMACLPLAPGMRPYEIMAFQFSCHTIPLEEGRLAVDRARHAAWLDDGSEPPASSLGIDRAFIDALEAAVGQDDSPIFHWSSHEKTVLKNVLRSRLALAGDPSDHRRVAFIDSVVGDENQPGRLVDMLRVAEGRVMAPGQQGRYSIKCVLPVACQVDRVWGELCALMIGDFPASAADSSTRDPYRMLGPLAGWSDAETEDDEGGSSGGDDGVQCGTAAMRAYQQLRFGGTARWEGVDRQDLKAALLRYCKLDTAAMVAVWSWMVGVAARRNGIRG